MIAIINLPILYSILDFPYSDTVYRYLIITKSPWKLQLLLIALQDKISNVTVKTNMIFRSKSLNIKNLSLIRFNWQWPNNSMAVHSDWETPKSWLVQGSIWHHLFPNSSNPVQTSEPVRKAQRKMKHRNGSCKITKTGPLCVIPSLIVCWKNRFLGHFGTQILA